MNTPTTIYNLRSPDLDVLLNDPLGGGHAPRELVPRLSNALEAPAKSPLDTMADCIARDGDTLEPDHHWMACLLVLDAVRAAVLHDSALLGNVTIRVRDALEHDRAARADTQTYTALAELLTSLAELTHELGVQSITDADRRRATNPYWALIEGLITTNPWGQRVAGDIEVWGSWVTEIARQYRQAFSCAITDPATVRFIAGHVGDRPVTEIAAGRGYWARQLRVAGVVDVLASDLNPPRDSAHPDAYPSQLPTRWYPVLGRDAPVHAAEAGRDGRVLLICWPPGTPMATDALDAYAREGGDTLIYLGEGPDGACADGTFFHRLAAGWHLTGTQPQPSWWNTSDRCEIWRRLETAVDQ